MEQMIADYWPWMLIALVIAVAIGWFVLLVNRKTSVKSDKRDVLDEGAERARRNQALIDAAPRTGNPATSTPAPAPSPAPSPASAPTGGDDLTRIKGLGPKIAAILGELGVTRYADIAEWDDAEIDRIDALLGKFQGRIRRDSWVEQAKLLSSGDESGFIGKFGQNG